MEARFSNIVKTLGIVTATVWLRRKLSSRSFWLDVLVFLCVLLFAYTALSKLVALPKFLGQIRSAPFIGPYSSTITWAVPMAELTVAAMMTWPRLRMAGLMLFITMMATFTAYIIYIIRYASHIPCSCGGVLEAMGWGDHLIFNMLFMGTGMAAMVMVIQDTQRGRHELPLSWNDIKDFFRKKQGEAENL